MREQAMKADVDPERAENVDARDGHAQACPTEEPGQARQQGDHVIADNAGKDSGMNSKCA